MKKALFISIAVFLAVVIFSEYGRYKRNMEKTVELTEEIVTETETILGWEATKRPAVSLKEEEIEVSSMRSQGLPETEEESETLLTPDEEEVREEAQEEEPVPETEKQGSLEKLLPAKTEENVFRIVCIGDSVTAHPYMAPNENPAGYWLQEWGMAASAEEKDYAHVLASMFDKTEDNVSLDVINFNSWELAEASMVPRASYLSTLDPLFGSDKEEADLIVLQLGENCTAYQSLAADFGALIDYLRAKAPNAEILATGTVIIMDPPRNGAVDSIKQQVCSQKGVIYVDMSGYNESMWVGEGTQIVNPQGQVTVISVSQRTHPGDYGMQWIAEQIYNAL